MGVSTSANVINGDTISNNGNSCFWYVFAGTPVGGSKGSYGYMFSFGNPDDEKVFQIQLITFSESQYGTTIGDIWVRQRITKSGGFESWKKVQIS